MNEKIPDWLDEPGAPPEKGPRPPVPIRSSGAGQGGTHIPRDARPADYPPRQAQRKLLLPAQFDALFAKLGLREFKPSRFWHEDPISERQLRFLREVGIDGTWLSKGAAGYITDFLHARREQGLATVKQVRLLVRMHHPAPTELSFGAAQEFIAAELAKERRDE
jgi:hypothetical protein